MDMKISGKGVISSGEYGTLTTGGSERLSGFIKCESLASSGTLKGDGIECTESVNASGRAFFLDDVKAKSVNTYGNFSIGGNLYADTEISSSGKLSCGGSIKCDQLFAKGKLRVGNDIAAKRVKVSGALTCQGLVADEVKITFGKSTSICNIDSEEITATATGTTKILKKIPVLSSLIKNARVGELIKGKNVNLEYVSCPLVTASSVIIGDGCSIGLVQYTKSIKISPKAKVGKAEKI